MSYDTILQQIGEFGTYQKRVLVLVTIIAVPTAVQVLNSIFLLAVPEFRCAVPGLSNDTYEVQSPQHLELVNTSLTSDPITGAYGKCSLTTHPAHPAGNLSANSTMAITLSGNTSTEYCPRWVYSTEVFSSTLAAELNFVCDRQILTAYANIGTMSGSMAGSLISGVIADRFGRRLVLVASVVCHAICGFCLLLVDSFLALVAVRFLVALFGLAIFMTGCTLAMEIVGESKRSFAGMLLMYGWVIGMLFVSAVAYFARDWRVLQLILSSPTLLLISYYWILPESPRWLLDKQRYTEASKVLKKIAEVNKASEVDDKMLVALCEQSAEEGKTNVQEENFGLLLKSRTMVIRLAILCVNWCVCTMVYYGLTLNVGAIIEGDLYVNFFIMSVMELFAYALCTVTLDKLGRKKVYCTCLIVSGLSCLGTMIPILVDSKAAWINVVLSNIGKFGTTACFAIVYIFSAELLPTLARNTGIGVCSFMGRVGSVISPYIGNLHYIVGGKLGKSLPLVIFGGSAVVAGILSLYLPETSGTTLPETVEDAKAMKRAKKRKTKASA